MRVLAAHRVRYSHAMLPMTPTQPSRSDDDEDEHATLRTLDRGLRVLEILAASPSGLSFSEVIERANLSTGTVNRLLQTLVRRGYVDQDKRSKTYRLGLQILELQGATLAANRMAAEARPYLRNLMLRTGRRVHLAVYRGGSHLVYIDRVDNQESLGRFVPVGRGGPPHATSLGKAILAFSPPEVVDDYVGHSKLERLTDHTITDVDQLRQELLTVRGRGYATENEESAVGTHCIGAPIFDYTGSVVTAVNIAGRDDEIDPNLAAKAQMGVEESSRISDSFGFRQGSAEIATSSGR